MISSTITGAPAKATNEAGTFQSPVNVHPKGPGASHDGTAAFH
jgi:hypothetical protein